MIYSIIRIWFDLICFFCNFFYILVFYYGCEWWCVRLWSMVIWGVLHGFIWHQCQNRQPGLLLVAVLGQQSVLSCLWGRTLLHGRCTRSEKILNKYSWPPDSIFFNFFLYLRNCWPFLHKNVTSCLLCHVKLNAFWIILIRCSELSKKVQSFLTKNVRNRVKMFEIE